MGEMPYLVRLVVHGPGPALQFAEWETDELGLVLLSDAFGAAKLRLAQQRETLSTFDAANRAREARGERTKRP